MEKRLRLNIDSTHFIDSYKSKIKCIDMMRELISEIVRDQKIRERGISNDIKEHFELKYRCINDHINHKWEYRKQDNKSAENQKQEESNLEENDEREQ